MFQKYKDCVITYELESHYICSVLAGAQTVVQPGAQILAEGGPIVIGEGNLIQEQATIINRSVPVVYMYLCMYF